MNEELRNVLNDLFSFDAIEGKNCTDKQISSLEVKVCTKITDAGSKADSTTSIVLYHKGQGNNLVDLLGAVTAFELYGINLGIISKHNEVLNSTLLIPSIDTKIMLGTYTIKLYIDLYRFVDLFNIVIDIEF